MKKQIGKLKLSKRTISNLRMPEMTGIVGGAPRSYGCEPTDTCTLHKCPTQHGHTCNGRC